MRIFCFIAIGCLFPSDRQEVLPYLLFLWINKLAYLILMNVLICHKKMFTAESDSLMCFYVSKVFLSVFKGRIYFKYAENADGMEYLPVISSGQASR